MSRTWRTRLQLVAGLALIALAAWIVLRGTAGSAGSDGAGGSTPSPSSSATYATTSSASEGRSAGLPTMTAADLPPEGRETLDLVRDGGPFPYDRDGTTFYNREGLLPDRQRGYYAEYTVPTPGSEDRGARRLVVGDGGEVYYTDDHYASFRVVQEET